MTNETTPTDAAAMPPASAGSRADQCRCGLATRLVGDGCEHCNPAMVIDILREQVAEMRLTDEEREVVARLADRFEAIGNFDRRPSSPGVSEECERDAATLRSLLERLGAAT